MIGARYRLGLDGMECSQINYQISKLFAVTFIISVLGLSFLNYLFVRIEKMFFLGKRMTQNIDFQS